MTVLGDNIKRWCQEESLSLIVEQDDEAALACAVSLPADPPLSISVRASGPLPSRVVLGQVFELPAPAEMSADPEGPQRIAMLLERVAAGRSGLVECRQTAQEGKPAAEAVVTLHQDGISKQSFLSALEEVRKVVRVIAWELEGISAAEDVLSEVRAVVEQSGAFTSEFTQAAEGLRAAATPVEAPPPQEAAPPEPAPAPLAEPAPAPQPAVPPEPTPPPAPAGLFCPKCGKQAKPEQRFCIGCGAPLEGQG